jgi:hypothetical protein
MPDGTPAGVLKSIVDGIINGLMIKTTKIPVRTLSLDPG